MYRTHESAPLAFCALEFGSPEERGQRALTPGRRDARECPAATNGGSALSRGTGSAGGPRLLPFAPPAVRFGISDKWLCFQGKKKLKGKKDWIKPNFYLSTVQVLIKKLAPNLNPDYAVKCIEPEAAWLFARPMIH